jgi:hypothetical protein
MSGVAIFVAKLLDPIAAIVGILVGYFSHKWWHVALAVLAVATIAESILFSVQYARTFHLDVFLIGIAAAATWVFVGYLIKRWISRRRPARPPEQGPN